MQRLSYLPLLAGLVLSTQILSARAALPGSPELPARVSERASPILEARGGCGSRGGPGYRKANGQCAGWKG